jgi:hypothetical protein
MDSVKLMTDHWSETSQAISTARLAYNINIITQLSLVSVAENATENRAGVGFIAILTG